MDNQQTVAVWADEAFGLAQSDFRVAARANEELAELLRAFSAKDTHKVTEEAADTVIVLYRLGARLGIDLDEFMRGRVSRDTWRQAPERAAEANHFMARLLRRLAKREAKSVTGLPRKLGWWERAVIKLCLRRIVVNLSRLCDAAETDLRIAIALKMNINREREWKVDGSGHGYHVREKPPHLDPNHIHEWVDCSLMEDVAQRIYRTLCRCGLRRVESPSGIHYIEPDGKRREESPGDKPDPTIRIKGS